MGSRESACCFYDCFLKIIPFILRWTDKVVVRLLRATVFSKQQHGPPPPLGLLLRHLSTGIAFASLYACLSRGPRHFSCIDLGMDSYRHAGDQPIFEQHPVLLMEVDISDLIGLIVIQPDLFARARATGTSLF